MFPITFKSFIVYLNILQFLIRLIQAGIATLVAYGPGTGEVPGSNPGKGKNY